MKWPFSKSSKDEKQQPERDAFPLLDRGLSFPALGSGRVNVTERSALTLGAVWRAVNLVSNYVGKLPLELFIRTPDGGKVRAYDDPRFALVRYKAADNVSAIRFRQTLMAHVLLRGNGYAYIDRDEQTFAPRALWTLNPATTFAYRQDDGSVLYRTSLNGKTFDLPDWSILHIRGLGFDGLTGYSVISYFADDASMAITQRNYAAEFFSNGAVADVVISPKNGVLDREKLNLIRDSWIAAHSGEGRRHGVAVSPGELDVKTLTIPAGESQLLESRQFSTREIANWFGLPPHKLGDTSNSGYNSIEAENQSFLDDCLDPWLVSWEQELRDKLLTEREKASNTHIIEFNRQAMLQADMAARSNFYRAATAGAAWMTTNEVRIRENMNPVEGGDKILQPLNIGAQDNSQGGQK